jgi:hypothetical protein
VSPETLLNLAVAATALRLALYGLLPLAGNPWAVLPVELLHGVTFGLGWGAATAASTRLAPPHLAATMQVGAVYQYMQQFTVDDSVFLLLLGFLHAVPSASGSHRSCM